ncbi:Pentatricopeptide repeat-containing protein 1, mitochondrial [Balamuthia mandrillaris]
MASRCGLVQSARCSAEAMQMYPTTRTRMIFVFAGRPQLRPSCWRQPRGLTLAPRSFGSIFAGAESGCDQRRVYSSTGALRQAKITDYDSDKAKGQYYKAGFSLKQVVESSGALAPRDLQRLLRQRDKATHKKAASQVSRLKGGNEADYVSLIRWLGLRRRLEEAFLTFETMDKQGIKWGANLINALLNACWRCGNVDKAMSLWEDVVLRDPSLRQSPLLWETMVTVCAKARSGEEGLQQALGVWREMKQRNVSYGTVTLNALIGAFCRAGEMDRAFLLFQRMRENLTEERLPSSVILPSPLTKGMESSDAFSQSDTKGAKPSLVTYKIMIGEYLKREEKPMRGSAVALLEDLVALYRKSISNAPNQTEQSREDKRRKEEEDYDSDYEDEDEQNKKQDDLKPDKFVFQTTIEACLTHKDKQNAGHALELFTRCQDILHEKDVPETIEDFLEQVHRLKEK